MKTMNILLVEDDEFAAEIITDYLEEVGFGVTTVFTATDGVARLNNEKYDLLILDINLPDFDGYEVLKNLRNRISIPIIMTSAFSDTKSKLLAFKYGAGDYMVKPLDLEELEARIWLQLGKNSEISTNKKEQLLQLKDGKFYFQGIPVELTTIEYDILNILFKHKNQTIRREDLVQSLSSISSNRSLDNHIKNIRKKLNDNGNKATLLKTEYGVGYRLVL